jgi:hypothetical protein
MNADQFPQMPQEPRDYRFVLVGLAIAASFFLGYVIGAKN